MDLIENVGKAHRMLSVQVAAIGAAAAGTWLALSEAQQAAIVAAVGLPPGALAVIGFVAVILGRVISQPSVSPQRGGGGSAEEERPQQ